jgi:hypothetical protein
MGEWKRIKPDRQAEIAAARWWHGPEGERALARQAEAQERARAAVARVLAASDWGAAADAEGLAAEVLMVLGSGTDRDVALYLRDQDADPPGRPARPLQDLAALVAELRAAVADERRSE